MANIVPGSPIALEGMPPTDGLLAGIVCLSPTLAGSLGDAIVAHVVGNMEDEGLNKPHCRMRPVLPTPRIFMKINVVVYVKHVAQCQTIGKPLINSCYWHNYQVDF